MGIMGVAFPLGDNLLLGICMAITVDTIDPYGYTECGVDNVIVPIAVDSYNFGNTTLALIGDPAGGLLHELVAEKD